MAQRRIIETYGHTIAGRRSFVCASGRFFCPSSRLLPTTSIYIHRRSIYIHRRISIYTLLLRRRSRRSIYIHLWLWCPGLSPVLVSIALPVAFHTWCFPFALTCHWISIVFLLYGRRIATHSVHPSLIHSLGEFPGLELALVSDVVVHEAEQQCAWSRKLDPNFCPGRGIEPRTLASSGRGCCR